MNSPYQQPNEITLKAWVYTEAEREGVKPTTIYNRISRGKYPALRLRRVNHAVIFVQLEAAT